MKQKPTVDELIENFAEGVIAQRRCLESGNSTEGNKHAKEYLRCWDAIRKSGSDALQKMLRLLSHENDNVREMAAVFLLRFDTVAARRVLTELSSSPGLVGLGASEALKRWEEGNWHLDEE